MQKYSVYSFSLRLQGVERERRKARGSRSTKSLFIDMKVKIFACNVQSLETNPESVQIRLQRAMRER
jgi:hypothetical protein